MEKSPWKSKYCKNLKSGVLRSELNCVILGKSLIFVSLTIFICKMKELDKKDFKLFLAHPMILTASVFQASSYVCFIWGSYS